MEAIIIRIMLINVIYDPGCAKLKVHPINGTILGTINLGSFGLK